MRRVWVVDDHIPIQSLYPGPYPTGLEPEIVRHLVENAPPEAWEEPAVLELCRTLCAGDYEPLFFTSPDAMLRALGRGALPPHAVVFDWEYLGSTPERNINALDRLLGSSFAYVQIYTHLGEQAVEAVLPELRTKYRGRVLPTRTKADVTAEQLAAHIGAAWKGTIAGELADRVRGQVMGAVEGSLIDICEIRTGALAAMVQRESGNLVDIVLSKVRDQITLQGSAALDEIAGAAHHAESSDELRRLMSVWYYSFPADRRVRRGDLIEIDGEFGLVVTPPCDLYSFPKKAGRRLTWLKMIAMDEAGIKVVRESGLRFDDVGDSIIAKHGRAGESIVVLPNVPTRVQSRDVLADFVVLCHAWANRAFDRPEASEAGELTYAHLEASGIRRRCCLAEPFAGAVIARAMSVISSPGTPDLPKGETDRLRKLAAQTATETTPTGGASAAARPDALPQGGAAPARQRAVKAPKKPV
jgi:hypothetical protein